MENHDNRTPKNHIKLTEAYALFRSARYAHRGSVADGKPPRGKKAWRAWKQEVLEEQRAEFAELAQPFMDGILEALTSASDGREFRITPDEWRDSFYAEHMFIDDTIRPSKDGPLAKHAGRTPYVERCAFENWLAKSVPADGAGQPLAMPVILKSANCPAREAAKEAIAALWPDGIPNNMRTGERDRQIIAWCKRQQPPLYPPSERSIRRTLEP